MKKVVTMMMVLVCLIGFAFGQTSTPEGSSTLYPKNGALGIGGGLLYGVMGINGEISLQNNIDFTVGYGMDFFWEVYRYNAGVRYYFRTREAHWRPRVGLYFGTNSLLVGRQQTSILSIYKFESSTGLTLGIGQRFLLGKQRHHGIDLDLMYIISNNEAENRENLEANGYSVAGKTFIYETISVSLGYHYIF